jgi:hypothetical protein
VRALLTIAVWAISWGGALCVQAQFAGQPPPPSRLAGSIEPEPTRHPFTPIQVSLATPIQLFPETWDVAGLRLDLIQGRNHNTGLIDVGVLNQTVERQVGLQVGVLWNGVGGEMTGIQVAGILNSTGESYLTQGLQVACINSAGDATGLQVGVYNHTSGGMAGMQIGLVNVSGGGLNGIQIGLINVNTQGPVPFFPILNVGY